MKSTELAMLPSCGPSFAKKVRDAMFALAALPIAAGCSAEIADDNTESVESVSEAVCSGALPSTYGWSSSGPLVGPPAGFANFKDYSVVQAGGKWNLFGTAWSAATGYEISHVSFTNTTNSTLSDFQAKANWSGHTLINLPGVGVRYAPDVFYMANESKWYLIFVSYSNTCGSNAPWYSTNTDVTNPNSWTAPQVLHCPMVATSLNKKALDFNVICDSENCYDFFANDSGQIWRMSTTLNGFPTGWGNKVKVLDYSAQDPQDGAVCPSFDCTAFEAPAVYKVKGQSKYLMIVESRGGADKRYFNSWTATALNGAWTPQNATQTDVFAARSVNVTMPSNWSKQIGHGDLVRSQQNQTKEVDPCKLELVYQGKDPDDTTSQYEAVPYRLGVLTEN